ncbi:MAG: N-acetyltransferase family protein [Chloroflexota bacterium]
MYYSVSMDADRYPAELERDVQLRGGRSVRLRPIRPDDAGRLKALHSRLSRETIFSRFFSHLPVLSDERAAYFTTVDYHRRLAIVAVDGQGQDEEILGVARYDNQEDGSAEMAIVVEDRMQRLGIGSVLLAAIIDAARRRGVRSLIADVLGENRRMLHLLRETHLPYQTQRRQEVIRVTLTLSGPAASG